MPNRICQSSVWKPPVRCGLTCRFIGNKVQPASIYSTCSRQPKKPDPGATMTDRNRSFGTALGLVIVLIVVAALAATLAP